MIRHFMPFSLIFLLLISFVNAYTLTTNSVTEEILGKGFIRQTPHTITNPNEYLILDFTSYYPLNKNLDFYFGFDSSKIEISEVYLWNNISHPRIAYTYKTVQHCDNNATQICKNVDVVNGSYTEYDYYYDWERNDNLISNVQWNSKTWHAINSINLNQNENKKLKIRLNFPYNTQAKYDIIAKPSTDSLQSNSYILLDPWINSTAYKYNFSGINDIDTIKTTAHLDFTGYFCRGTQKGGCVFMAPTYVTSTGDETDMSQFTGAGPGTFTRITTKYLFGTGATNLSDDGGNGKKKTQNVDNWCTWMFDEGRGSVQGIAIGGDDYGIRQAGNPSVYSFGSGLGSSNISRPSANTWVQICTIKPNPPNFVVYDGTRGYWSGSGSGGSTLDSFGFMTASGQHGIFDHGRAWDNGNWNTSANVFRSTVLNVSKINSSTVRIYTNGSAANVNLYLSNTNFTTNKTVTNNTPFTFDTSTDNLMFQVEFTNNDILYQIEIDANTVANTGEGTASENDGRDGIVDGINNALLLPFTIYTGQRIYARNSLNNQSTGTFDKVVKRGNRIWAFNYITNGESHAKMFNITPNFYTREISNMSKANISIEVSSFINSTK